jgi:hypothetical protein
MVCTNYGYTLGCGCKIYPFIIVKLSPNSLYLYEPGIAVFLTLIPGVERVLQHKPPAGDLTTMDVPVCKSIIPHLFNFNLFTIRKSNCRLTPYDMIMSSTST